MKSEAYKRYEEEQQQWEERLRKSREESDRKRKEESERIKREAQERNERYERERKERELKKQENVKKEQQFNIIVKEPEKRLNHYVPLKNNKNPPIPYQPFHSKPSFNSNFSIQTSQSIIKFKLTNQNMPSLTEQNRQLNQYDNKIFNEQHLIQSNCFHTSDFDENAFNDYTKKVYFEDGKQMNCPQPLNNSNKSKNDECILI